MQKITNEQRQNTENNTVEENTEENPQQLLLPGFSKENAFSAFVVLDKICTRCDHCKRFKCPLFIAKECISDASLSGRKLLPHIPSDILNIVRELPISGISFDVFKLHDAYQSVITVCDDCGVHHHQSLCAVNIALTALGRLLQGKGFETNMDKACG